MKVIKYTLGVDISKLTLDVCLSENGFAIEHFNIRNHKTSIRALLNRLEQYGVNQDNSWLCAEHTGLYGLKLQQCLEEMGFSYSYVPAIEIIRSIGFTRGKNDKVDATRIAEYAYRFQDKLSLTSIPPAYLYNLARLYTFRKQRIKHSTQLKNQIKELECTWSSAPQQYLLNTAKKELKQTRKVIDAIEHQMEELIASDPSAATNYSLARSVTGIGTIIAIYLIICTENFTRFKDVRKFASYAGLAPFEHRSGTSLNSRPRTSIHRNKDMKILLLNGATAISTGKHELAKYYHRKLEEGKHKMVAKNALAFKMVARVFATIKRQTPYVPIYRQNFA